MDIDNDKDARFSKPLCTDLEKMDKNIFCRFHKDVGHDTKDCRKLKDEIDFLIC